MGPRRPCPSHRPRLRTPPRHPRPRPRLEPRALALLARPPALRPHPPRQPHRPSRTQGLTQGVSPQRGLVRLDRRAAALLPRERRLDGRAGLAAELAPPLRLVEQPPDLRGERLGIAGRDEQDAAAGGRDPLRASPPRRPPRTPRRRSAARTPRRPAPLRPLRTAAAGRAAARGRPRRAR